MYYSQLTLRHCVTHEVNAKPSDELKLTWSEVSLNSGPLRLNHGLGIIRWSV